MGLNRRSLFLETESAFDIVDLDIHGNVCQVWSIFWSEKTERWAVFAKMPTQVTKAWWERKGEVY